MKANKPRSEARIRNTVAANLAQRDADLRLALQAAQRKLAAGEGMETALQLSEQDRSRRGADVSAVL